MLTFLSSLHIDALLKAMDGASPRVERWNDSVVFGPHYLWRSSDGQRLCWRLNSNPLGPSVPTHDRWDITILRSYCPSLPSPRAKTAYIANTLEAFRRDLILAQHASNKASQGLTQIEAALLLAGVGPEKARFWFRMIGQSGSACAEQHQLVMQFPPHIPIERQRLIAQWIRHRYRSIADACATTPTLHYPAFLPLFSQIIHLPQERSAHERLKLLKSFQQTASGARFTEALAQFPTGAQGP